MYLVVDEVINASEQNAVVLLGSPLNWFDLPTSIAKHSARVIPLGGGTFANLIAPMPIKGQEKPASVAYAEKMFGSLDSRSYVEWPVTGDMSGTPGFKLGMPLASWVQNVPYGEMGQRGGNAVWVFTIRPDGSFIMTAIQMLTYQTIGANGMIADQGIALQGINELVGYPPPFGQQPPPSKNALRIASWTLPVADQDLMQQCWSVITSLELPEQAAPATWTKKITQTVLKADTSPLRAYDFPENQGAYAYPSSPMWHISILAGDILMIDDRGMYDYTGAVVRYDNAQIEATALSKWDEIRLCMLTAFRLFVDAETGYEGVFFDFIFDEMANTISPTWVSPLP